MTTTSRANSEFDREALIEIAAAARLPAAIQARLLKEAQAGDGLAASKVVAHNMGLVVNFMGGASNGGTAVREHLGAYTPGGNDYTDLFNEGAIGLQKAVADYTPARGSFEAWATLKIRSQITEALQKQEDQIKLPKGVIDLKRQIYRLQQDREMAALKPLSTDELAAHFGKSRERILEIQNAGVVVTSLQSTLESGDELGTQIADTTPATEGAESGESDGLEFDAETIERLLSRIPERKQQLLRENLLEGKSVDEIAQSRGLSTTTIRQQLTYATAMFKKAANQYRGSEAAAGSLGAAI